MSSSLNYSGEIYRKSLHLLALAYPLGYVLLGKTIALWILVPLSITAITLDLLRGKNEAVHGVFDTIFGFMMRPEERQFDPEKPPINGASWVTASFTVLAILFPGNIAIYSFLMFMIGDAVAALVGRKLGKHRLSASSSVEGTLAFVVFGLLITLLFSHPSLPVSVAEYPTWSLLVAVFIAAGLEAAPLPMNDNIIAPLGACLFLYLIG